FFYHGVGCLSSFIFFPPTKKKKKKKKKNRLKPQHAIRSFADQADQAAFATTPRGCRHSASSPSTLTLLCLITVQHT
ncbi:hypothetical protein OFM35_33905, partial [Escherichia coli]|nr:hypothetical protein [Escherichia coli]